MKIFRKIKISIVVVAVVAMVFTGVAYVQNKIVKEQKAFDTSEVAFEQNQIDKALLVSSLKENFQIVGMEGKIEKQFGYQDKLFDAKWDWVQNLGQREYITTLNGTFKMGFSTKEITENHIFIEEDGVKIITPPVELISLELPYDQMAITEEVGMLRRDFTEAEKQYIYAKAKEKIETELINDEKIIKKAREKTIAHLIEVLEKLTDGQKVEFVNL